MANPNWPSFPGLANLTQDGDGRPQVLDLIPGRQRGTPLTSLLFNPILRKICDLQDGVDGLSGNALSGTLGLVPGDLAGLGLHFNHGTGRAIFGYGNHIWRDVAWGSEVDGLSQQLLEALQTVLSGTAGLASGDRRGIGLHTNGSSGKPTYGDDAGWHDLALDEDVQALLKARDAINGKLEQITGQQSQFLSGTAGLAAGDLAGLGLHFNHGTGRAIFGYGNHIWRDVAWGSEVDGLSQQLLEALQTVLSGTAGLASGDRRGIGLHTNGSSGKPTYGDDAGWHDLALDEDVQALLKARDAINGKLEQITGQQSQFLSGTAGLAPGDAQGVGLHNNHGTDRPTFGDATGRWRDVALTEDLNSRLPVSSPTASGSLTVVNNGTSIGLNPNSLFNGQLRGQITWGNRSWYPGGDGLIFRDNGNIIVDSASTSGPTTIQRMTVQGSHGNKILFPQQFNSDNVQVFITTQDSGNNLFHVLDYFSVDRYGVVPSFNSWISNGFINEHGQTWMMVLALGSMT